MPLRTPGDFAVDQAQQMVLHGKGGHQQLLVAAVQVAHEHILEEVHRIRSDDRVGSEQGKVGVEGGGFFVEVAGADLGDIAQTAVFLPAGDEADLGVALVAFDAVYHPAAGLLQLLGPFDVVLLIKPRPEFHQHGDRLAVFRCGAEVFGHSRVAGQPIDGHLDGEHLGVVGGLPEQPQEGLHRLVGIEQQDIPLLDLGPEGVLLGEIIRIDRSVFGVVEGAVGLIQLIGILEDQRAGADVGLLGIQLELLFQQFADLRGIALHLQPYRRQTAALAQGLGHVIPQVLALVVVDPGLGIVDVGIPGHRDDALLGDVIGLEDLPQLGEDHLFGAYILGIFARQQDNGRQRIRHFHDSQQRAILAGEHGSGIERLVLQMGEGVAAVDDLGESSGKIRSRYQS